jgi:hypothetical protein
MSRNFVAFGRLPHRDGRQTGTAEQADPAVCFFLACLEYRLASAAERYADPEFRSKLAANVDRLAAAVRDVQEERTARNRA